LALATATPPTRPDRGRPAAHAAPPAPPLLEARGVTLRYRTPDRVVTATDGIDLQVRRGDRLVLLGPSGCGKSSLLRAAAGFLEPDAGAILLDGRRVRGPGPDRVVVFQEFDQLLPWRTVRQNVAFPLRAARRLGRREALARATAHLEKVGLAGFADAYPHTLSGGMKQRVAIARALAMEPRVLLMDEPFAALDALTRRSMQDELLALWRTVRCTLLFVTHSVEEALLLGNRVVVLSPHPGRVVGEVEAGGLDGTAPEEPAFRAALREVQALLGRAPGTGVVARG
jgi:NitT/TauT family transport system ATP-binding protein